MLDNNDAIPAVEEEHGSFNLEDAIEHDIEEEICGGYKDNYSTPCGIFCKTYLHYVTQEGKTVHFCKASHLMRYLVHHHTSNRGKQKKPAPKKRKTSPTTNTTTSTSQASPSTPSISPTNSTHSMITRSSSSNSTLNNNNNNNRNNDNNNNNNNNKKDNSSAKRKHN